MDLDLVLDTGAEQVPVVVAAQPSATIADLRRALTDLALTTAAPAAGPVLLDGRARLSDDAPLSACGLRPGAVLTVSGGGSDPPGHRRPAPRRWPSSAACTAACRRCCTRRAR
ncbi:hypothetical protein OHA72_23185 [Dactylosporangium sp. NBC_01737]|uniref:hypothetical protein n=1 Tax=Dactylosporangium sp. NBC_01737 TaxID=2975959 RepID=UPI002E0F2603|nr:hypothetical protein OHA72_23185 [Dactylosporangium sp. NBC_01737]